jgi:hypothetical protein
MEGGRKMPSIAGECGGMAGLGKVNLTLGCSRRGQRAADPTR